MRQVHDKQPMGNSRQGSTQHFIHGYQQVPRPILTPKQEAAKQLLKITISIMMRKQIRVLQDIKLHGYDLQPKGARNTCARTGRTSSKRSKGKTVAMNSQAHLRSFLLNEIVQKLRTKDHRINVEFNGETLPHEDNRLVYPHDHSQLHGKGQKKGNISSNDPNGDVQTDQQIDNAIQKIRQNLGILGLNESTLREQLAKVPVLEQEATRGRTSPDFMDTTPQNMQFYNRQESGHDGTQIQLNHNDCIPFHPQNRQCHPPMLFVAPHQGPTPIPPNHQSNNLPGGSFMHANNHFILKGSNSIEGQRMLSPSPKPKSLKNIQESEVIDMDCQAKQKIKICGQLSYKNKKGKKEPKKEGVQSEETINSPNSHQVNNLLPRRRQASPVLEEGHQNLGMCQCGPL